MVDTELGRDIRRLVDETVPPAPWLEDRVMVVVRDTVVANSKPRYELLGRRSTIAALAAMVVALLIVVTLLGTRIATHMNVVPGTHDGPSRDPVVVAYRSMVDGDMVIIRRADDKTSLCTSRQQCAYFLTKERTATEALLRDISSEAAPPPIAPAVISIQGAARQYITQLSAAIQAMQSPQVDYRLASTGPEIGELNLAVAMVECWPVTPVPQNNPAGYGCTPVTPFFDGHSD